VDVGIEVDAVAAAFGVGGDPAADGGIVVASSKVDKARLFVGAFGGEAPGVGDRGVEDDLFAKGAVAVGGGGLAVCIE
jgi:hypothetical protein